MKSIIKLIKEEEREEMIIISKHLKEIYNLLRLNIEFEQGLGDNEEDVDIISRCEDMFECLKECILIVIHSKSL
jgi:hypothetical protein